jgi:hypothetical protein
MHSFAKLTRPDSCFFSAFKCLYGQTHKTYILPSLMDLRDLCCGSVIYIMLELPVSTRLVITYQGSLSGHRGLCLYSSTKALYKLSAPRMLL